VFALHAILLSALKQQVGAADCLIQPQTLPDFNCLITTAPIIFFVPRKAQSPEPAGDAISGNLCLARRAPALHERLG